MINKKLAFMAIPALTALLIGGSFGTVFAGVDSTGPAMVVKHNEDNQLVCPFIDSNLVVVQVSSDNAIIVETNSKNGNIKLVCHAEDIFNDTGAEVVWNFGNTGLVLGGFDLITEKWEVTVSADGNAVLQALFKN